MAEIEPAPWSTSWRTTANTTRCSSTCRGFSSWHPASASTKGRSCRGCSSRRPSRCSRRARSTCRRSSSRFAARSSKRSTRCSTRSPTRSCRGCWSSHRSSRRPQHATTTPRVTGPALTLAVLSRAQLPHAQRRASAATRRDAQVQADHDQPADRAFAARGVARQVHRRGDGGVSGAARALPGAARAAQPRHHATGRALAAAAARLCASPRPRLPARRAVRHLLVRVRLRLPARDRRLVLVRGCRQKQHGADQRRLDRQECLLPHLEQLLRAGGGGRDDDGDVAAALALPGRHHQLHRVPLVPLPRDRLLALLRRARRRSHRQGDDAAAQRAAAAI
mmetsp:Transcript_38958/g.107481  ORF Transcript_38958/g.107481 Transcript_38958/m.107481 type:complete len:336 (+) Transcript_38958:199-1206(+)